MQTVRLNHAGAMIELPADTVVNNWLRSIAQPIAQPLSSSTPPQIGQYWPGQGGIFAGTIRGEKSVVDGMNVQLADRHIIVPTDDSAELAPIEWSSSTKELPSCSNEQDGTLNTQVMADNGSKLAQKIRALEIDGHKDFYLPARNELRFCSINVPELFSKNWYWSSTQYSANNAFCQAFDAGTQSTTVKHDKLRARAVRSIQVSNSIIR